MSPLSPSPPLPPHKLERVKGDVQTISQPSKLRSLRRRTNAYAAARNEGRLSPILKAIAFTVLLPNEFSFLLGDLRLTLIRVIFVVLTPILFIKVGQMFAAGVLRFLLADFLVVASVVWMCVATTVVGGIETTLAHTAPIVLEYFGGYLATRVLVSRRGQALNFIRLICYAITCVSLLGLLDTLTSSHIIHDFLGGLTGNEVKGDAEFRLGLVRASGVMDHPILYGAVCAFGVLLGMNTQFRGRRLTVFVCGLGNFLSLSAGPIQAAVLGSMLIVYDRIFEGWRDRWKIILVTGVLGIGAINLATNSPLNWVFGHLTFDPGSGWSRIFEWETVGDAIARSPWVGVAYNWSNIVKTSNVFLFASIDSLWLLWAITYGIPGAILLALSIISAASERINGADVSLTSGEQRLATTLSIILWIIVFLGFTVDFWGPAFILIGILMGVRVHISDLGKRSESARRRPTSSVPVSIIARNGSLPLSNPG